ncbi:MAG: hypothetical protein HN750_17520 [Gemmatimonadales bacterium]|jgi:hypothetical protein|nr:hypothetical protein [Gemmatimonadales bacterium]
MLPSSGTIAGDPAPIHYPHLTNLDEFIDSKARSVASHKTSRRTGRTIPLAKVHRDLDSCDAYMDAWVAALEAMETWDPDRAGGMTLRSYVLWRMFKPGNDTSWFKAGARIPKVALYPYLANAIIHEDIVSQRVAWLEMGYDGFVFDQVHGLTHPKQMTFVVFDEAGQPEVVEPSDVDKASTDPTFDGQMILFRTEALTEIERLVWTYRQAGYTNSEIDDMVPHGLLPKTASPKSRAETVSRIYSAAKAKASDFFGS